MRPPLPSILEAILATKRDEVAALRSVGTPPDERIGDPPRSLRDALDRRVGEPMRVLAEIKRASPSAGPIRPGADPVAIAREYAAAGAAAISVLTDRTYFAGDLAFVAPVRAASGLPVLRKDFIIDPLQIDEAWRAGADAILLIVAALERAQLSELLAAARARGLDVLVEAHSRAEAEMALDSGTTLIGVNHRDLHSFQIDMTLTAQIAARIPDGVVLVAESGIKTAADVRAMTQARAHAVLVGEHLMRATSPGDALRELLA